MTEPSRADRVTRCSVHRDGATILLVGDIDLGNRAEITARMGLGIRALDLTGVRYFGAAGVRLVLDAFAGRPFAGTLHVRCAPSVFRVMRISGLLDVEGLVVTEAAMERQSPAEAGE